MAVPTTFDVASQADLNNAIATLDTDAPTGVPAGTYTIDLTGNITETGTLGLYALLVGAGVTVEIDGNGHTLDGAGTLDGLAVIGGKVSITDLTIEDTLAKGGAGSNSGGGGAGLGGGLFVGPTAAVTVSDVSFKTDAAKGGAGGSGGGGGAGGHSSLVVPSNGTAAKGTQGPTGAAGTVAGSPGGNGGNGGPGVDGDGLGVQGGAGAGGLGGSGGLGGHGGFGGGGGGGGAGGGGGKGGHAAPPNTKTPLAPGGTGGTGGTGSTGGGGGFGGGGGGGGPGGLGGQGSSGTGASGAPGKGQIGGFGGGGGAGGGNGLDGAGGGGLGAGGDIFVAGGGTLTVDGGLLSNGKVTGGAAGSGAQGGGAYGSGIFLQGNETITLSAPEWATLAVDGSIADQTGSGGGGATAGTGALVISGQGTVKLAAKNSFVGGITVQSGTLDLAHTGAAGKGPIRFDPGVLEFAASAAPTVALQNFSTADGIVVDGFAATGHSFQNGLLTLDGAGGAITLDLPGATASAFAFGTTQGGNVAIGDVPPPCFAAGARLVTARGEVAVEDLRRGDRVCARGGHWREVVWLGHREVDCRRHPRPQDVLPVRIVPHAFGRDRPRRTLHLSPDHAVLCDGVLIPVRYLLNGASIAQVPVDRVAYWHVELRRHDVMFAEGLACESYLDTGNRAAFANGGQVVALRPEFARGVWQSRGCAPLVIGGAALVRIKARLIARLPALGWRITRDAALRLELDGGPVVAARDGETSLRVLPRGAHRLVLRSRVARPAELDATSEDCRLLGIALRGLCLDGVAVALDDARLTGGWHAAEPGWRWSDGAGAIDVRGATEVALNFASWLRYCAGGGRLLRTERLAEQRHRPRPHRPGPTPPSRSPS